ncbi:MAG: redoxin domain-containing protein [Saprospiraceae bacterium]
MARLNKGQSAPLLKGKTSDEEVVDLNDYLGTPFILSFYRYAGCQFCNLRMKAFIEKYHSEYAPSGIKAIAVFQSPESKMAKNLYKHHEIPFAVVADPKMKWYKEYGLEKSWAGLAKSSFRLKALVQSISQGYAKIDPDGPMNRMPADFLIGSDGTIADCFYAADISEHISFEKIKTWADSITVNS